MKQHHPLINIRTFALILFCAAIIQNTLRAQEKRPFAPEDFRHIQNINDRGISDNGQIVWYSVAPLQYGDPMVIVHHLNKKTTDTLHRTARLHVATDGSWMAYIRVPAADEVRTAKFKDPKAAEKFNDTLVVVTLSGKASETYLFPAVKSLVTPTMSGGTTVVALLKKQDPPKPTNDTLKHEEEPGSIPEPDQTDNTRLASKSKKGEDKRLKLLILDPVSGVQWLEDHVTVAAISPFGKHLCWISQPVDTLPAQQVHTTPLSKVDPASRYLSEGFLSHPVFSFNEQQLAILEQADTSSSKNRRVVIFNDIRKNTIRFIASPEGLVVSNEAAPFWLERTERLIVNTAVPETEKQEDSLLKEERFTVDIWKWDDPYIQSQQLKDLDKEKKRSYRAMVTAGHDTLLQIEDAAFRNSNINRQLTNDLVLIWDDRTYAMESTWRGSSRNDIYLMRLSTGKREMLFKEHEGHLFVSPDEAFLVWYSRSDSAWWAYATTTGLKHCITCQTQVPFYNELHDVPGLPSSNGLASWGDKGRFVILNSSTDLWKFDLRQQIPAACMTCTGNETGQIRYRYVRLDSRKLTLEGKEEMLLSTFHLTNREAGYASLPYHKPGKPATLIHGPYRYSMPEKSRNHDRIIWRRESFNQYPELWVSDLNFRIPLQISYVGNQYQQYYHGTSRLVRWKAEDGHEYEGLLSLPENRNGLEKIPMVVTFYERHSDDLHRFRGFAPSRSVINTAEYLSNGYAVFEPDIHYGTGTPGDDALRAVVSGTRHVLSTESIDPMRVGIQGQSWGGYQVAYIITQTNLFAAAMAGAPVSNMTSAYGAIRWESGRGRLFQYEEGQSRLGVTMWNGGFERYFANSPLFFADSIRTPLLIMHNDNDGAVPWTQSIELYLAMRRMQKPVWLLVYNNEAHNLMKWPNRVDLNIRMKQFFDFYLMEKPQPVWMSDGRPATLKETDTGYQLRD